MRDPWRGRHRLMVFFIVAAGIASYAASLDAYFIKDDLSIGIVTAGGHELHAESWFYQLIWPTQRNYDDIWRPVPPLTWACDFLLFGPDPIGFHLWNLFFHCLNGVLLYWLTNRLTRFRAPTAGFFAGLLFVLYPLHGEALLWATQRFVVLGLTFYLLALLACDLYLHRGGRRYLFAMWGAVVLATMTKELGVTLPGPLCLMALFSGPTRPFRERFKTAFVMGVVGLVLIGIYFQMRHVIFDRYVGGYAGWPTMQAYAEANRVFEKLPTSLATCAVPLNRVLVADGWAFWTLAAGQALVALWALARLGWALKSSREARFFLLLTVFVTGVTWLPTVWIFYVEPSLLNSRFGYHPLGLIVALLATGLVAPWSRQRSRLGWLVPGALAVVYAVVLQINLRAYDGGGAQVRRLQESVATEAELRGPEDVYVVLDVPHEWNGCPTVDRYLPALLSPPLLAARVATVPLVVGQQAAWPEQITGAEGLRAIAAGRNVRYYRYRTDPPALARMFGDPEPADGDVPATLLEPRDGALLLVTEPEPWFRWRASRGHRYVLHLDVPGRQLRMPVVPGENAEASGDVLTARLTRGGLEANGEKAQFVWPLPEGVFPPPAYPVLWRVETLDASGKSVGITTTRRLVILEHR